MSLPVSSAVTGPVPAHQAVPKASAKSQSQTSGDFSFLDILDIVNPLQHIPVVSSIYREWTGDTIKGPARVLGGALFGGPIGAVLGGVNAVVASENKGKDVAELAMNKLGIGKKDDTVAVAEKAQTHIPVIEVHPSDKQAVALPIEKMPFAIVDKKDIVWDVSDKMNVASASLPQAKRLNDLKPVAGLDPAFDDAVAMNNVEPGVEADVVTLDPSLDAKLAKMAADSAASQAQAASSAPAAAPIEPNKIPDQMLSALSKYQAMQRITDKAVMASQEPAEKTRMPFSGLDKKIRRIATN